MKIYHTRRKLKLNLKMHKKNKRRFAPERNISVPVSRFIAAYRRTQYPGRTSGQRAKIARPDFCLFEQ